MTATGKVMKAGRAEAEKKLRETPVILKTPAGCAQPSWFAIASKQLEPMAKFTTELGLAPSARSRLAVQMPAGAKPWEHGCDDEDLLARPADAASPWR